MSGWLWYSLCIFVFSMIVGVGGMLHALSGTEYGWHVVGISIVAHFFNCLSFAAYCLY